MYRTYADDIFRFLLTHVRDTTLAEDLTADTFVKAWRAIDTFDGKQPRAWLYKIAQNILTDHWRRKQHIPLDESIEIVDDRPGHDEQLDKQFAAHGVMTAVAKLPRDMQSVVNLRFMQGYSAKQTAEALGMSETNVRVVQYRALKKLKGLLS